MNPIFRKVLQVLLTISLLIVALVPAGIAVLLVQPPYAAAAELTADDILSTYPRNEDPAPGDYVIEVMSASGSRDGVRIVDITGYGYRGVIASVESFDWGGYEFTLTDGSKVAPHAMSFDTPADYGDGVHWSGASEWTYHAYSPAALSAPVPVKSALQNIAASLGGELYEAPVASTLSLRSADGVASPVEYGIYKLFTASVDDEGMASDIAYASDFTPEIMASASGASLDFSIAQVAAQYIADNIENGITPEASSFAMNLALAVADIQPLTVDHFSTGWAADGLIADQFVDSLVVVSPDDAARLGGADGFLFVEYERPDGMYERIPFDYISDPSCPVGEVQFGGNAPYGITVGKSDITVFNADGVKVETTCAPSVPSIKSDGQPVAVDGPGYYLVIRKDVLTGENTTASAPIFVLAGAGNTEIVEKSAVPAVVKQVQEDSTGAWSAEADATTTQALNFRLCGSLPSSYASYEQYAYTFIDEYAGYTVDASTVRVSIDNIPVDASAYTFADDGGSFRLSFDDLNSCGVPVGASSVILVEYSAALNAHAPAGALNSVHVEYSNNPANMDSRGYTKASEARVYSYALDIKKVDNATAAPLAGVGFTVKNAAGAYIGKNAEGLPVEQSDPYTWTTDAAGMLSIAGVDADAYTVEEIAPLADYKPLDGSISLSIDATDRTAPVLSIVSAPHLVSVADAAIMVENVKEIGLPLTGREGYAAAVILGCALVGFSLWRMRRNRAEA